MKPFRLACLATTLAILFAAGCGGESGSGNYFIVQPNYAPPPAYKLDTQTALNGTVTGSAGCDPENDPACLTAFGPEFATTASNGYVVNTDAVGNVVWGISGLPSANCAYAYSSGETIVNNAQTIPMVCEYPTAYFQATPAGWNYTEMPATITFTAPVNVFPTVQFKTASTSYETNGDIEWQGSPVSSTQTTITMAVPSDAVGTHVIVFRNPTTNAILGAAAYVVYNTAPNCDPAAVTKIGGVSPNNKCPPPK